MAKVCVFCSSMDRIDPLYEVTAEEIGRLIGERNHLLIYGGSNKGCMGKVARSAQKYSSIVTGIIPEFWKDLTGLENTIIVTNNLRDRKGIMTEMSDAFIALAGGLGTLDEIADVLVSKCIDTHKKPFAIVNTNNFYEHLLKHLDRIYEEGLVHRNGSPIYQVVSTPQEALSYIEERKKLYHILKSV
ncbi:TIGR00730 family Rossman fold protein [Candidatus Pacearchaeota archaeon]|nr:TIGR00730 family Rossman fold protein [Candidatus Pacearchaeota archaeon]